MKYDQRVADAYRFMATKARYRPQAPSDGFGNITAPIENLNLDEEAAEYAVQWDKQERSNEFFIGTPDGLHVKAMVYSVEAARLMCAGSLVSSDVIVSLLEEALREVRG